MHWSLLLAQLSEDTGDEIEEVLPGGLGAEDWIRAGLILAVAIALGWIIQAVSRRLLARGGSDLPVVALLAHSLRNLVILVGIVYALATLEVRLGPLLGALGIGGLAVAFAAQSILANTFASILLRTRRSISRGDQITAFGHEGTVEDITMRVVVLTTFDGERVLLPCAEVLNGAIVNHTVNGIRRTTLEVGVTYDTDLDRADRVLRDAVESIDGVFDEPRPEVWVEEFGESSIDFAVRYWHRPDIATVWRVRSAVAKAIKRGFDEAGITIPFPQRTVGFLRDNGNGNGNGQGNGQPPREGAVTQ